MKRKLTYMKIADRLGRAREGFESKLISHLFLCQTIAQDLKDEVGADIFNGYMFSKACGYDFDITK